MKGKEAIIFVLKTFELNESIAAAPSCIVAPARYHTDFLQQHFLPSSSCSFSEIMREERRK